MAAPRPEHAHATDRPATATFPPRPAHTTIGWRQDRRPVVSKRPLHSRAAAKMSPHIRIGPEPVLAAHARSPPAAGSHLSFVSVRTIKGRSSSSPSGRSGFSPAFGTESLSLSGPNLSGGEAQVSWAVCRQNGPSPADTAQRRADATADTLCSNGERSAAMATAAATAGRNGQRDTGDSQGRRGGGPQHHGGSIRRGRGSGREAGDGTHGRAAASAGARSATAAQAGTRATRCTPSPRRSRHTHIHSTGLEQMETHSPMRPPRTTRWATAAPRTKLKTPETHTHTLTHQTPIHQATCTHTHTHTHCYPRPYSPR